MASGDAEAMRNDKLNDLEDLNTQPFVVNVTTSASSVSRSYRLEEDSFLPTQKVFPQPPEDCCSCCDPVFEDTMLLAVMSTFCCWLPLGILPVVFGICAICYAKKARSSKDIALKQHYDNISRTISWIGLLSITVTLTVGVVILATCGVL